jgi:hypothetical protein
MKILKKSSLAVLRISKVFFCFFLTGFLTQSVVAAEDVPLNRQVEAFLRESQQVDPAAHPVPASAAEWDQRKVKLRSEFWERLGDLPAKPCPLNPVIVNRIEQPDYIVEALYFQSQPGVYVTATLHLPKVKPGVRVPAVLSLPGHQEIPWD